MEKQIKEIYDVLKFDLKSKKLNTLLGNADVELGEYGKYNMEQFLTIYNIYNKAENGFYSVEVADTLRSLYDMSLELIVDITKNPKDEEKRDRFLAIANIFTIYGIRTSVELNAVMKRQLKKGSKSLPSEERFHELVKKIIPQRKAQ